MAYTKEDKRRWLILQCRYYKGEPTPPSTLPEGYALMWDYEMRWVQWTLEEDDMIENFKNVIRRFHLETKEGDKSPLILKALLCNRYLKWSSEYTPLKEALKNFEKWYVDFYQLWKTNREHRADKRRPDLIIKCRYYRGEDSCPYKKTSEIQVWKWEKEWVEAIADSYSNRDRFFGELMATPCLGARPIEQWKNYAHHIGMPATLLACFGKNYGEGFGGFKYEMEEYFEHFLHDYICKSLK